jgi:hypothetical protein
MPFPEKATVDAWKATWTNRLVKVQSDRPELQRFQGKVGRVITINYGGQAIVDFADGGWYDIPNFTEVLQEVTDPEEQKRYDPTANSAQRTPVRQG